MPGLGNEGKSAAIAQIICGPMPAVVQSPTADQIELMAEWRFGAAIVAYSLACYHEYVGDNAKLAADIYELVFQYDSLVSTDSLPPLHGLPGWQYRLGDAPTVKNYINDAGIGVFSGFGWFKSLGKVPVNYCTQLELPRDAGNSCKTINLQDRIARLGEHVLRSTDGFRVWRSDQQFLSRSSAGRAAAAFIFGDTNEKFRRILEANGYVGNVQQDIFDPSPGDKVSWNNARVSNDANYQHVQALLEVDNWNPPKELKAKAKKFYDNYVATNTLASLDAITQKPADYRNMACVAGSLFGTSSATRDHLQVSLHEMGFLYYTLRSFSRTPVSTYAGPDTTVPADNTIPHIGARRRHGNRPL